MTKRLTRLGNSLALVVDRPLLEALEIDADTELELSTDGDVLVVTPIRDRKRSKRVGELVAEAHEQYGRVFRRLAE
jgi:antitoxin component of MazEF toxin-antitoxin module